MGRHKTSSTNLRTLLKHLGSRSVVALFTVVPVLGIGLAYGVLYGHIFFKEMLVSGSIIGMALLIKVLGHPSIDILKEDDRA